jgi:organic hydroperoxide reductase OsmC/OhrA
MSKTHQYQATIVWTGNRGSGTDHYTTYDRSHEFCVEHKPVILCSSDAAFRGDSRKYNPEDMLLYSISSCHMLWYLHLCADAGVIVTSYEDKPIATLVEDSKGGYFTEAILYPRIVIASVSMKEQALELHHYAHEHCFISRSVNFPVTINPSIIY